MCMSPVELPYVPILLDETFTKALWDTGAEKRGSKIILDFDRKSLAIQDSQVEDIKVDEGNLRVDLSETKLNVVANVLDNNTVESIIGEKVYCAIIRDLVLSSRDQLIEEQRTDPELGHIYRYLENPEDSSVNAAICEIWSRDFRLVEGYFNAKYAASLGEMRVYIPKSLRNEIMREFPDKPLTGHFRRFKTYYKIRDVCYFLYMRKFIDQYVSTCHRCQINNNKNALPADWLIPIVSNYPNEIVTLDLLGPYPVSRVRRNRYVLVITDHFSKWAEIIPLKKASARVIADNFFDNYISRFGAPIKLISDNGPQFISNIFEKLSERLGIRHVKTVVYRPQANRTERVNHDLVQIIANNVNEQHDTNSYVNLLMLFIRIYRHRKCDETEIGTGSLRDESSGFDRVQRRSNESRDGKKKGSEVKRELEGKGLSLRNDQVLPRLRKKNRREETVTPTTSSYNLRPRKGKREESRLTIERKTQQGGPVRSRKGRERNDSPYIEERTRSSNKNARRGGDQQRQDQERNPCHWRSW
ncbi:retrovirus-related Pol polyprotein from transposon 297 [Trichonephila clavipes]|nr:retrovirus-related Pol polyprotein from transposon 297 [Trichonephila clavipes]